MSQSAAKNTVHIFSQALLIIKAYIKKTEF